jgi:GNAT superfamily N-acetyltransferase
MPYEYFDRYVFDCWATYGQPAALRLFKLKQLDREGHVRWSAHDEDDHRLYAFEVREPSTSDRHAWTFVIERDGGLEIEEIYVRPEFRRLGHGRWLADRLVQLALEKGMPLRLWVPFADCKIENEGNFTALVATARRLGVQFRPCLVPWAAYYATNEQPGEAIPIEPQSIPSRPRTPRQELLAAVLALGIGTAATTTNGTQSTTASRSTEDHAVTVGTTEWDQFTERRAELIYKKNRQGLNESERVEFERLQKLSRAAISRAFPSIPSTLDQKLAAFEQSRGENEGTSKQ